jgi:hypothetical protein
LGRIFREPGCGKIIAGCSVRFARINPPCAEHPAPCACVQFVLPKPTLVIQLHPSVSPARSVRFAKNTLFAASPADSPLAINGHPLSILLIRSTHAPFPIPRLENPPFPP